MYWILIIIGEDSISGSLKCHTIQKLLFLLFSLLCVCVCLYFSPMSVPKVNLTIIITIILCLYRCEILFVCYTHIINLKEQKYLYIELIWVCVHISYMFFWLLKRQCIKLYSNINYIIKYILNEWTFIIQR